MSTDNTFPEDSYQSIISLIFPPSLACGKAIPDEEEIWNFWKKNKKRSSKTYSSVT
jgi:hypothetical protein